MDKKCSKKKYRTKESSLAARGALATKKSCNPHELRTYRCSLCEAWHLSSRPIDYPDNYELLVKLATAVHDDKAEVVERISSRRTVRKYKTGGKTYKFQYNKPKQNKRGLYLWQRIGEVEAVHCNG